MVKIAELDEEKKLVGYKEAETVGEGEVVVESCCDLPADGSFIWDGKKFIHNENLLPKKDKAPCSAETALYKLMKALLKAEVLHEGRNFPVECEEWLGWVDRARNKKGGKT